MLHDLLMIFIGIVIVLLIGGVILILKSKKINNNSVNSNNNKYIGSGVISFLFPLIGLIIYAVNVGRNDDLAKTSVKCAIASIVIAFAIPLFLGLLYLFV